MATSFQHSATFRVPVSAMHRAVTTEQYWRDRMAAVGGPGGRVENFTAGDTVRIEMVQTVDQKYLPDFVTRIRPGNLEIARVETWGPLEGDTAAGSFDAKVKSAPAPLGGTSTLRTDAGGCRIEVDGSVSVSVPLLGSRIESAIAQQLTTLMGKEDEFTADWVNAHR